MAMIFLIKAFYICNYEIDNIAKDMNIWEKILYSAS